MLSAKDVFSLHGSAEQCSGGLYFIITIHNNVIQLRVYASTDFVDSDSHHESCGRALLCDN